MERRTQTDLPPGLYHCRLVDIIIEEQEYGLACYFEWQVIRGPHSGKTVFAPPKGLQIPVKDLVGKEEWLTVAPAAAKPSP